MDSAMSEDLRQQYLSAMGIQPWFDPLLEVESSIPANEKLSSSLSSAAERSPPVPLEVMTASQQVTGEAVMPLEQTAKIESVAAIAAQNTAVISIESPAKAQQKDRNPVNQAKITTVSTLNNVIESCRLCELHTLREQVICGEGDQAADCLVLIDAPVMNDQNEPALLSKEHKKLFQAMLYSIGLSPSSVYMSSLVKCCTGSRMPHTSEMISCDVHLAAQVELIKPKVILVLGEVASRQLLATKKALPDLRLRFHQYAGIPVVASYHPFELLNSALTKRKVWGDLLQIQKYLTGSDVSGRSSF